jgi:hypothetical protein
MGLKKNLKISEDVIDVMVQIKQSLEDTIHLSTSIKRFKEMAKTLKKKVEGEGLDLKIFQFLEILVLI